MGQTTVYQGGKPSAVFDSGTGQYSAVPNNASQATQASDAQRGISQNAIGADLASGVSPNNIPAKGGKDSIPTSVTPTNAPPIQGNPAIPTAVQNNAAGTGVGGGVGAGTAAGTVSDSQAQQNLLKGGLAGSDLAAAQSSLSAYQQGHAAATASGTPAPQDAGAGMSAATTAAANTPQTYVPTAPVQDALVKATQKYTDDYAKYMTSGQGETLVQQYQDLSKQLGIPALDTQLINMKNVIDGTENDIRNEVTKASGFATDSQVLAMTNARNKVMIQNYNNLLQTKSDAMQQVQTLSGLAAQDRTYASAQIDKQLNFDQQQITFATSALKNAQDSYTNTAKDYGWGAVYKSALATGDPAAVSRINSTMGNGFDLATIAGQTPMSGYQVVKGGTDAFGNQLPDSVFNSKTGQFMSAPAGGSTGTGTGSGDPIQAASQAIQGNESNGSYTTMSPVIPSGSAKGQQSYGKYQVLGSNIPSWTQQYYGQSLTPQQFLANPAAQDAVQNGKMGELWNKYGNIQDVASVYFTGVPYAQAVSEGRKDQATGMTVQQYVAKAAGSFNTSMGSASTGSTPNTASASGKTNFDQYGLLSKTNFNPGNLVDGLAQKYLDQYIKNGNVPTASSLGRNMKPEAMAQVDARARELYYQATGNSMPSPELIKGYQQQLIGNNKLTNSLNLQEGVVGKNAALLLQNLTANNLNDNSQPINQFIDNTRNMLGDPAVAQYLAQNATVSNELGSLLSLKNAQGTTVHDKLEAAGIINKFDSQKQIAAKVKVLLQEAVNSHDAINQASASLYAQTDPLMQDANNPMRQQTKNSGFVEQALTSQGLHYDNLMSEMTPQAPPGHQPALDAGTGKPVFATPDEIKSGKYIPL